MTASTSPLAFRALLSAMTRVVRVTQSLATENGIEIVGASAGNRPLVRPFSTAGDTDIDVDYNGLGSGKARMNGDVPVPRTDGVLDGVPLVGRTSGVQRRLAPYWARRASSWTSDPGAATVTNLGFAAAPTILGTASSSPATNRNMIAFTTAASIGATSGILSAAWTYTRRAYEPTIVQAIRTQGSIADVRIWAGAFSADPTASSTAAGHLAAFRYATDTDGTAFWRCVTRDGSTTNTTTTTAAIATGTEYVLRIELSAARVEFFIDDLLVAEHTTQLPGSTTTLSPAATMTALAASAKGIRWGSTHLLQAA